MNVFSLAYQRAVWRRLRHPWPAPGASVHVPLEQTLLVMLVGAVLAGSGAAAVETRHPVAVGLAVAAGLAALAIAVVNVRACWGPPDVEAFRPAAFWAALLAVIGAALLAMPGPTWLALLAALPAGYLAGLLAGTAVPYLGWAAFAVSGLCSLLVPVLLLLDGLWLALRLGAG